MPTALTIASFLTGMISLAGNAQTLIGAGLLARFRRRESQANRTCHTPGQALPAVTILKPLHEDEPLLEQALESVFLQDYPRFQIVFGVHSEDDSAIPVVRRLQQKYPHIESALVIDAREHGPNRKVGNLINMFGSAMHDILVISDSDIHVSPCYLRHVVATLDQPGTELVTTLYAGKPATGSLVQQLGACQINHNFLPGVMMSRLLGRQDCLGATMALTRQKLAEIGGLEALANHVADDAELGHLIRLSGGTISIAPTLTHTTVGETTLTELLAHELRWGRTVKNVEPVGYGLSSIQLPLFWATMSILFRPNSAASWAIFALAWLLRATGAATVDRATGSLMPASIFLLPVRDWLSAAIMVGSAKGSRVAWRGRTLHITKRKRSSRPLAAPNPPDANRSFQP